MSAVAVSLDDQLAYWKQALAGAPTKLELPTDKARPATQSLARATESFVLPKAVYAQLEAASSSEQATPSMTLAATFLALLNRYTGQDDILLGAPVADAGAGVRTLVLRGQFTETLPVRALVRQVRDGTRGAEAHAEVSFQQLCAALVPAPDASHAPLCQVTFVFEGRADASSRSEATRTALRRAAADSDLTLFAAEGASGLEASIAYATDLFEAATIRRMCGHLGVLLEAIARDVDQPVAKLPLLTARERSELDGWNQTAAPYPALCSHQLFEQQAARQPDATAYLFEGRRATYRELNEQANRIAHLLRKKGIGPDLLVGVCLERCPDMVAALLGVWKAGGAYVPLDPAHPKDRLAYMLGDAAAKVLVTDAAHRGLFPADVDTILVDADAAAIAAESGTNLPPAQTPSHLAYVMYTSGSTGQPKGVMIVQRGLVNYLTWAIATYRAGSGGAVPVHSSIAFDLTVTALFVPLAAGGSVEILREDVAGQKLVAAMREGRDRSLVKITPAHLALLSDQLGAAGVADKTRLFVIGGENLLAESLVLWRDHAPATRLINEYGPTETVVGCCVHEVAPGDPRTGNVIIGRAIANTKLYVLDRHRNLLPVGAIGELFIGGDGVARGYLNRPDLTQERFLPDPFSREAGARMYKSGDLARYRPDGALEYFGRIDNQVKVRGYRIELGEIEAVLADHPGVKACAVLARDDIPGGKQLVGYVVGHAGAPAIDEVRQFLRARLPEYMVPVQFVTLDAMPLTGNGKVDRKNLPPPSLERAKPAAAQARAESAPRTEIETTITAIWKELLTLETIGVDDNFFELGGHSLLAIKAGTRVREAFGVDLSPQAVIDDPTVAALARTVSGLLGIAAQPEPVRTSEARRGPFFFGEPALFGTYHPPLSAPRDIALLVCPSIGHEHTRGHRAIQILCESAARAGVAALRFDYSGVGDSAGVLGDARVETWCDDVVRAAEELLARSGAKALHIVGLRLGAAIAAAAINRVGLRLSRPIESLILWDALLSGHEFLEQAKTFQDLFLNDRIRFSAETIRLRSASGGGDNLVGYGFPEPLRQSLRQLDLRDVERWPAVTVHALWSEPSAASATWEALAARLVAAGRAVTTEAVKGAPAMWADYALNEKTLRAGPLSARIVDLLSGGSGL
jgi:amino acid adenylation domain-containing protein